MAVTLFGHPVSHNTRKVQWALAELEWDYTFETVDIFAGAHKEDAFLARNPNGRVPVLTDGSLTLFESNAILHYLAERSGRLMPDTPQGRALVTQWLSWQASDLADALLRPWLMKVLAGHGQPLDEEAHRERVAAAQAPLEVLDAVLEGRGAIDGVDFSIADIAIAESIGLADVAGVSMTPFTHIRRWFEGISARPAFASTRSRS